MQKNFESCASKRCFGSAILIVLLFGSLPFAQSQAQSPAPKDQEVTVSELLKLPGKIIAQGTNTRAAGVFKLVSYRIEEVVLPRTTEMAICGQKVQVGKVLRVTVTGGPFPVRALPGVIWIDDTVVGYGVESEDLDAITAVTFDYSPLREGATIYLSYGDKTDKNARVEVPEKLKLKN